MTKTTLDASTAVNMQLLNIKKNGEYGDMITIEFMVGEDHVVANEWITIVKAATLKENAMRKEIDFGTIFGTAVDDNIGCNGITVNDMYYDLLANDGAIDQSAKHEAIHFYIVKQMQRFIELGPFKEGKLNELDIDHEAHLGSSLQVTRVRGWQVAGADRDEFFYRLGVGENSVSFFAWADVEGEQVEFCLNESPHLDESVMAYYRRLEQDQFTILKGVTEALEGKIADRKQGFLINWDEESSCSMPIDRKNLYRKPDGTTMNSQEQLKLLLSISNFTPEEAADVTGVQPHVIKTYRKASCELSVPASIIRPLEGAVLKKLLRILDAAGYATVPKHAA